MIDLPSLLLISSLIYKQFLIADLLEVEVIVGRGRKQRVVEAGMENRHVLRDLRDLVTVLGNEGYPISFFSVSQEQGGQEPVACARTTPQPLSLENILHSVPILVFGAVGDMEALDITSFRPFISIHNLGSFILRAHRPMSKLFSCPWFNEVDRYTPRDQQSIEYEYQKLKRMNPEKPFYFNMFKDSESRAIAKLFWHRLEEPQKIPADLFLG